jgi:hypothetical protein
MHILWIILQVIVGVIVLGGVLVLLLAWWMTKDGGNPFQ